MRVVLLSTDLIVTSQLQGAAGRQGGQLVAVGCAADLRPAVAAQPTDIVLLDLSVAAVDVAATVRQLEAIVPAPRIVAFGPHVHQQRLDAAREAGCDDVLSRGQLHAALDEVFQ